MTCCDRAALALNVTLGLPPMRALPSWESAVRSRSR